MSHFVQRILQGPPCSDFSRVNATREGIKSCHGHYMRDFGCLIRKIEKEQKPHPLFHMAENVCLSGNNLEAVCAPFEIDWHPIRLDV